MARQLLLQPGAAVARIQRVRQDDGIPLSFDETYLPQELGEKIMADDLETQPIFALLEQKYATALIEAEYWLAAVASHGTVARALPMQRVSGPWTTKDYITAAITFVSSRAGHAAGAEASPRHRDRSSASRGAGRIVPRDLRAK